jgi:murein hydrolase activator
MEKLRPWSVRAVVCAATLVAVTAVAQQQPERDLEAVRDRIQALERRLAGEQTERDRHSQELREVELRVAAANRELDQLRTRLREQQQRAATLQTQTADAGARLGDERDALARQVRASYMTGDAEVFRLLLSQEDPADIGRMVVYYEYLLQARGERLERAREELGTLMELAAETAAVRRSLEALEAAQAAEVATLAAARSDRQAVLSRLEASIAEGDAEVQRLRAEEARLVELIEELSELVADFPVNVDDPFTGMRGRLAWPVAGELAGDFGRPRNGGPMQWNGVLLETAEGAPVRAVYHGRVVFSDWLPGLGLLVILDHGDGYMSLYGHNEALLKDAGDWASPGEVIAQAGDTGGLARPSLYFEIRHNGTPVNPNPWFAGRPGGR